MSYHIRYKCQWHDQASSTSSSKKNGGTINVISAPVKVWSRIISRIFNPEPYPDGRKSHSPHSRETISCILFAGQQCTNFGTISWNNTEAYIYNYSLCHIILALLWAGQVVAPVTLVLNILAHTYPVCYGMNQGRIQRLKKGGAYIQSGDWCSARRTQLFMAFTHSLLAVRRSKAWERGNVHTAHTVLYGGSGGMLPQEKFEI